MDTPMSGKDAERRTVTEAVRRAEEALEELTALGLSVDVVLSNRILSKPRHLPVEESDTLLEGEGALAYLNNPELADCVLVLGSQHIRASSGESGIQHVNMIHVNNISGNFALTCLRCMASHSVPVSMEPFFRGVLRA